MLFPMEENENYDSLNDDTFGVDSFGLYFVIFKGRGRLCKLYNIHFVFLFCTNVQFVLLRAEANKLGYSVLFSITICARVGY